MKATIHHIPKFAAVFVCWHNGIAPMHHDFDCGVGLGSRDQRVQKALKRAENCKREVEEALSLRPPEGYVFAGIAYNKDRCMREGVFRKPARAAKEERKTDARLGDPTWLLAGLVTGADAVFMPIDSDWAHNGLGFPPTSARRTMRHQLDELTPTIFTVGSEEAYDKNLAELGAAFEKLGTTGDYPGGFACRTAEDADRLIDERGKRGDWAVYEVRAEWGKVTRPSRHGWWHGWIKTSRILRKVTIPVTLLVPAKLP